MVNQRVIDQSVAGGEEENALHLRKVAASLLVNLSTCEQKIQTVLEPMSSRPSLSSPPVHRVRNILVVHANDFTLEDLLI